MSTASFIARSDDRLSLRIPASSWKASGRRAAAAMAEKGAIVMRGAVRDWAVGDMREEGSWVLASGPAFQGLSLEEALASGYGKPEALKLLASLASALRLLSGLGRLPERIYEEGILFAPDGGLLILPMGLSASACSARNPDAFLAFGGGPESGASALMAAMLRRVCAQGKEEAPPGIALALLEPSLDHGLAALADRGGKGAAASIDEYCAAFEAAQARGFFHSLSEAEASATALKLQSALVALKKKETRSRFFKRRGGLLTGIAIGMAAILALGLLSLSSPGPDYSGLDAPELVAAYYGALDGLDMMGLEACVSGSAGKDDRNFVANLTVIRKMRQAYGDADLFVNAKDWLSRGSPPLGEGAVVYGISGLAIREAPGGTATESAAEPDERGFEARYAIWSSYGADEGYRVAQNERIDTLSLRRGRRGWKIVRIERISP